LTPNTDKTLRYNQTI